MSIRLRLTLWYTTILAAVVIVFGAALYSQLTLTLMSSIDRQLETTSRQAVNSARIQISFLSLETMIELPDLDILAAPGLYIQVYDVYSNQIVERSDTMGELTLPVDQTIMRAALNGESQLQTVSAGGQPLRVLSQPVQMEGRLVGIVQVATSLAQVDQTQRQLLGILIAGGLLAVVTSAGLGALLARAALRPIDRLTQAALSISRTEDLGRRLEISGPADEVGRLTATFNEMLSRLESLFKTQQRFIADVSHELRTPLTTIQGNVDLLRRGVADDPQARREIIQDVESELARMSRLVADLLLLARVDAGVRLEARPVEMDTLLLQVYRQAQLMSDGVEIRLGHEDQAIVLGDADRLQQLLLNLVDNALKYTRAGGQVVLSLYREEDWVRLVVADTGIGIPAEDLAPGPHGVPLIFERFYRADPARARGGAGLGLSIAHWIVQAHAGRIQVESEIGAGSTFTVWLPAHDHQPEEQRP